MFYPALFDSLWNVVYNLFNATSSDFIPSLGNLPQSVIASTIILKYVTLPIVFMDSVIWLGLLSRRHPVVPTKPTTLSSKIVYICRSARLLQDVHDASGTVEERMERLRAWRKGYAFGWFKVNQDTIRLGVEREPMETEYSYGRNSFDIGRP